MKENSEFDFFIRERVNAREQKVVFGQNDEDELWNNIVVRKSKNRKSRLVKLWGGSIAACIALFMAGTLFISQFSNQDIKFSTAPNIEFQKDFEFKNTNELDWANEFITAQCEGMNYACSSPEFVELQHELELADKELQELESIVIQYGYDEFIIQSKIKIENHKSEIALQMVQILLS